MHLYKCSHTPQVGFGPNLGYRDSFPKKIIVSQKLYGASKNSLTFSIFPHSSKNPHIFLKIRKFPEKSKFTKNFENFEKYEMFKISTTKNVEHVLQATPTINSSTVFVVCSSQLTVYAE